MKNIVQIFQTKNRIIILLILHYLRTGDTTQLPEEYKYNPIQFYPIILKLTNQSTKSNTNLM